MSSYSRLQVHKGSAKKSREVERKRRLRGKKKSQQHEASPPKTRMVRGERKRERRYERLMSEATRGLFLFVCMCGWSARCRLPVGGDVCVGSGMNSSNVRAGADIQDYGDYRGMMVRMVMWAMRWG